MDRLPGAAITDNSHDIVPYDIQQAAYVLLAAYKHFPKGTIHISAVDVFAGNNPVLLMAEKDGHFFLAADNGIFALTFGNESLRISLCKTFARPFHFRTWVNAVAEAAEKIINDATKSFPSYELKTTPRQWEPAMTGDSIDCNILHIDRYENVVLDITREQFDRLLQGRRFRIRMLRRNDITSVSRNYTDVPDGMPLCRFNNAGFLEVALNHAPAAPLLGLDMNNTGNYRYQAIKIFVNNRHPTS